MKNIFAIALLVLLTTTSVLAEPVQNDKIRDEFNKTYQQIVSSGPNFSFTGTLTKGRQTSYSINGEDFDLGSETVVVGSPRIGSLAEVRGQIVAGKNIASALVIHEAAKESVKSAGPEM